MTMICKDAMAAVVANPQSELDSKPMNLIQPQWLCLAKLYKKKEHDTRQSMTAKNKKNGNVWHWLFDLFSLRQA